MKKFLIVALISVFSYALTIDPSLMYSLGAIKDVPAEDNPVIGLSFLKFGIIQSWLESSSNNSVVTLSRELFRVNEGKVEFIDIAYLTPKDIGFVVQFIETYKDNYNQLKQKITEYMKELPGSKDSNMPDLLVNALQYVDMNTVYPKGSIQTLLLAYLCSISVTRGDIESYYQGFLNNPDFTLSEPESTSTVIKTSKEEEKKVYKNYFCSIAQTAELQNFMSSFAQKNKKYDALQNLVLLFFDYKDGYLIPNKNPSSLTNYISVSALGTMIRIVDEYQDPKVLVAKLGSYLVGLKILNRTTKEFLDEKNFRPLLIALSESIVLTQDKNAKYSYDFFKNILQGCVCSRLVSFKDIQSYSNGLFEHVTLELLEQQKKQFACCMTQKNFESEKDHEYKHEEPWELEFEHSHDVEEAYKEAEEAYNEISDEIVERTVLFDLASKQVKNPVEAIIFQLSKIAQFQEEAKKKDQGISQSSLQEILSFFGGLYTLKERQKRQEKSNKQAFLYKKIARKREEAIKNEADDFNLFLNAFKNIPGISYQQLETEDEKLITIAAGGLPVEISKKSEKSIKEEAESSVSNEEKLSDDVEFKKDTDFKPKTKKSSSRSKPTNIFQKPIESVPIVFSPEEPLALPIAGFVPEESLGSIFFYPNKTVSLPVKNNHALIPVQSNLICSHMQPTIGNLALGLQHALGLEVIPDQDIHLMIDAQVAARYFNEICNKFNWKFDLSGFDPRKPLILKTGKTKITIDLNMQKAIELPKAQKKKQRVIESSKQEEILSKQLLVPAAEMRYQGALIIPPQPLKRPEVPLNASVIQTMPDTLVASILLAGISESREIEKYKKILEVAEWMKNIQLILQAQQAFFEFVSLVTPKPYERVMSKLNEIMNDKKLIKNNLVGYELQNFFDYSGQNSYRQGISQQDINEYFEYAPAENIATLLNELSKLSESQRYNLFTHHNFSSEALASLFERMPIENLLSLFDDMDPKQKLDLLKKLPQTSLKSFVNDLSMQEFSELFKNIGERQMQQLKISDSADVLDTLYDRIKFYSQSQGQSGEHFNYVTMSELERMNKESLQQLAAERYQAYENRSRFPVAHEVRSLEAPISTKHFTVPVRKQATLPINYRRYLQPETWRHYIAEHGSDVVSRVARDVVRSGSRFS